MARGTNSSRRVWGGLVITTCVLLSTSTALFAQQDPKPKPATPRNEVLTAAAWKALEKKDYKEAIAKAEKCIELFEGSAVKLQKELKAAHAKVPIGEVTEEQKKVVHKNGLLNDVATCYYIKAKAHEELKEMVSAIRAYKEAEKLTYGRTWDPKGPWFWSPADAASERLEQIGNR